MVTMELKALLAHKVLKVFKESKAFLVYRVLQERRALQVLKAL
jgi:hypothetical protein